MKEGKPSPDTKNITNPPPWKKGVWIKCFFWMSSHVYSSAALVTNSAILFWLYPFREIRHNATPGEQFCGNWVLNIVIRLCSNFRSCTFVIFSNNPRKLLFSSCAFFPSKAIITFGTDLLDILYNSADFVTYEPAIRRPTIWTLWKYDRFAILNHFNYLFLMKYEK